MIDNHVCIILPFAEEDYLFMSRIVYYKITMDCRPVEGATYGDWFWDDEGVAVKTLPPCQVFIKKVFFYFLNHWLFFSGDSNLWNNSRTS